ncbi:solute carrier family 35 member B1-like isoform X1 [Tetranychus urticae]|uniref:solute carrier family 35 member B1-like isoform X1 n=1 Tax=Tetranychus urticae TaxID=32264 RepID=UPI000D645FFA|nr:solute carrier family 35 member B1-like isoform X1 [Tetranychus urticae]
MGWDSFGLPAENAALERSMSPAIWTYQNIKTMEAQLKSLGLNLNWREATSDLSFYRWTQWLFLQLFNDVDVDGSYIAVNKDHWMPGESIKVINPSSNQEMEVMILNEKEQDKLSGENFACSSHALSFPVHPIGLSSFYKKQDVSRIFVCYFYYGLLQEKITRSKYGSDDEKFVYPMCLVLCQCIVNAILAQILLRTIMKQGKDTTRISYYSSSALTYFSAMVFSNMALQHVNYPTQVVGKSCKPVPVMILGVLFGRKRYPVAKYLFVMMIVIGVILFMYKDKPSSSTVADKPLLGWGEILLLLYLTMDGLTGAIQERMKSEHKTQSCHMMFNLNLWSIIFSLSAVLVTGEWLRFLNFIHKYPYVTYNIRLLR